MNSKFKMNCSFLILVILMTLTLGTSNFDLPEIIYETCPYTDICNRTASMSLNVKGLVPCCSSCKCDDDCGLRLDCCFDEMDTYRLKEKGIAECVNTFIGDRKESYWQEIYLMIQACKSLTVNGFGNKRNNPCRLYDEKGRSLVEPVSSKERGYIYVNADCARCNDVYNFVKWNYVLLANLRNIESLVWDVEHILKTDTSSLLYIPPDDDDWSMHRCVVSMRHSCDGNSTFAKLCKTLQVPYYTNGGGFVRNPFCMLCTESNEINKACQRNSGRISPRGIFALLDHTVISPSQIRKTGMIDKNMKSECPTKLSVRSRMGHCLQIFCPDGMLMTEKGCRYLLRHWHTPSFQIQIKLLASEGNTLHHESLNVLTLEERENPLLWMQLPCRQETASALDVFYEIGKDGQKSVESFIVTIMIVTPEGIDPSITFPDLRKCLKHKWSIEILGQTHLFHPTFYGQGSYIQDGKMRRVNKLTKEKEKITKPKLYEKINRFMSFELTFAPILPKTVFCDKVKLPMDEVEVLFGEIRIISKNVTLGNNEFTMNFFKTNYNNSRYFTDLNKTTVSVCLNDYDHSYYQSRSGNAMRTRFVLEHLLLYYAIMYMLM